MTVVSRSSVRPMLARTLFLAATLIGPGHALAQQRVAARDPAPNDARALAALLARTTTIYVKDVPRKRAIQAAATSAGIPIQYQADVLEAYADRVTVQMTRAPLRAVLDRVLSGTTLVARVDARGQLMIVERRRAPGAADSTDVSGVVVDSATGKGVSGVTIKVQGTNLSTVTGTGGHFTLRGVPAGDRILNAKVFGYRQAVRNVSVGGNDGVVVRITMMAMATALADVVTTATGQQRRLELGNDITVLNVDSLRNVAPITNVTDLLESRVPGVEVLHTSGTPGAPARVRVRGASSITRSNDPIVVVDGVRIYAAQSDPRNVNVGAHRGPSSNSISYATPSPLDQIDPNAIETIEVLKGPSAAAIYGSDAGNGVIVITTKKGKSGPTQWSLAYNHGLSFQPGKYPVGVYRFGHSYNGEERLCYLADIGCHVDSVQRFQALNDPRYTVLDDHGLVQQMNGTLSGGVSQLTYILTGTLQRQTGQLKLPDVEAERFARSHAGLQPPNWMRRPDRYATAGVTSSLTLPLGQASTSGGRHGTVSLSNSLFKSDQQQSSLQTAISQLLVTYVDTSQLGQKPLISDFYERATSGKLHAVNALQLNWPVFSWLPLSVTGGLDLANTTDQTLTPRGYVDTLGYFSVHRGTTLTSTLTLSTSLISRWTTTPLGLNLTGLSVSDLGGSVVGLRPGESVPSQLGTGAQYGASTSQNAITTTTYGWYAAPTLNVNSRFFVTPGIRLDGGSASGTRISAGGIPGVNGFPKLGLSWLAVDPSRLSPSTHGLFGALALLRLRGSFGIAGVQPDAAQHLRQFAASVRPYDGSQHDVVDLAGLGNTHLRPERSQEIEGGFDAELWRNRVSAQVTQYRKVRNDAIVPMTVAPSVLAGMTVSTNIGQVRASGTDVALQASVIERARIGWHVGASFSHQQDRVTRLAAGTDKISTPLGSGVSAQGNVYSRIVPGYPLNGKWVRPVVGYADANGNGVIEPAEVLLGDSLAYVGRELPNYQSSFNTDVTLGRLSLHTAFAYENGLTQFMDQLQLVATKVPGLPPTITSFAGAVFLFGNDAALPLSQQAAFAAYLGNDLTAQSGTPYGLVQTVNTLRWQSVSINYAAPAAVARLMRSRRMILALQGSNLGLWTNYRGKDPDVNAFSTGESVMDAGQLPQPRTFSLRVTLSN